MAIRDRFRRALRKSDSSDSMSQSDSNSTTASTRHSSSSEASSPIIPLTKSSSFRLTRTFTFGSRDKDKDNKEKPKPKEKARPRKSNNKVWMHPSQRPLTEQNLRHQEMLSHFTMTFGTSNASQLEDIDYDGVSPCCTRPSSIDGGSR
ncbi:hypothetical protein PT974_08565 [Cladobotryum mycophilum]|uniref:Uncharacterized protein n=1 Tax=Cladobotryum mycophilum TaxID=491253 RepID=A0ABR0SDQ9_9HYPO